MHEHSDGERRGRELIGMPVISIKDGRRLGEVTALLLDRKDAAVAAIRIGSQIAPGQAVPFKNLRLVGADVVLVNSQASLDPPLPTEEVRRLDDAVLGRAVITASGERIGTISGFWINTSNGRIQAYRVHPEASLMSRLTNFLHNDTFDIEAAQVRAFGQDALIVADTVASAGMADTHSEEAKPVVSGVKSG